MTFTTRFDRERYAYVVCLYDMEEHLRKKLFEMLSRNFATESIFEWESLTDLEKDFPSPELKWALWELDWKFYVYKGLKVKLSIREEFASPWGRYLVIEAKVPITASFTTWARKFKKK